MTKSDNQVDARETRIVTLTVTLPVTLTMHVAQGEFGAEVVEVKEAFKPEASEVMEALGAHDEFHLLDKAYAKAT